MSRMLCQLLGFTFFYWVYAVCYLLTSCIAFLTCFCEAHKVVAAK